MHWLHSIEQIVFQIGSTCHLTDEYYRVLCELLEDRQFAVISSMSEAKRSESGTIHAKELLADKNETLVMKLRSEATLIQNESRSIIARPAFEAAFVEIWAIQTLISEINPHRNFLYPAPIAHQKSQYFESILDLAWRSFVEICAYGALSVELRGQQLSRGLDFDFSSVKTREDLYRLVCAKMHWSNLTEFMTPIRMQSLWDTVNSRLCDCKPMQSYIASHTTCLEDLNHEVFSAVGKIQLNQISNK